MIVEIIDRDGKVILTIELGEGLRLRLAAEGAPEEPARQRQAAPPAEVAQPQQAPARPAQAAQQPQAQETAQAKPAQPAPPAQQEQPAQGGRQQEESEGDVLGLLTGAAAREEAAGPRPQQPVAGDVLKNILDEVGAATKRNRAAENAKDVLRRILDIGAGE